MGVSPSFYFSELSKPILDRGSQCHCFSGNNPKELAQRIKKLAPQFPLRGGRGRRIEAKKDRYKRERKGPLVKERQLDQLYPRRTRTQYGKA